MSLSFVRYLNKKIIAICIKLAVGGYSSRAGTVLSPSFCNPPYESSLLNPYRKRLARRHMGPVKNSAAGYYHLKIKAPPGNYQGEPMKKGCTAVRKNRSPKSYRAQTASKLGLQCIWKLRPSAMFGATFLTEMFSQAQ